MHLHPLTGCRTEVELERVTIELLHGDVLQAEQATLWEV